MTTRRTLVTNTPFLISSLKSFGTACIALRTRSTRRMRPGFTCLHTGASPRLPMLSTFRIYQRLFEFGDTFIPLIPYKAIDQLDATISPLFLSSGNTAVSFGPSMSFLLVIQVGPLFVWHTQNGNRGHTCNTGTVGCPRKSRCWGWR